MPPFWDTYDTINQLYLELGNCSVISSNDKITTLCEAIYHDVQSLNCDVMATMTIPNYVTMVTKDASIYYIHILISCQLVTV